MATTGEATTMEFPCPFCGRAAGFVEDLVRGPAVMHAQPLCPSFEVMEAHEYARAVNDVRFGGKAREYRRLHVNDQEVGGFVYRMPTAAGSLTGGT